MLNNKVVAGSLSLALLAAPSLFGLDVASAAAYTKAAKKPTFTISGAVNAAVRHVDNNLGLRTDSNVLVGQTYSDFEDSYLQAVASGHSGGFGLTGILRLSSRLNSFLRHDEDNRFVSDTATGMDDEVYLRAADVRLKHKSFGEFRIGKSSTGTGESTKANFANTGYFRGDITNIAGVNLGGVTGAVPTELAGNTFGAYELNGSKHRIQYNAPTFVDGLTLSAEYVSQSDSGAGTHVAHDNLGFSGSFKTSVSGVDLDVRAGYTSRAHDVAYRRDANGLTLTHTDGASPVHLHALGASAAFKVQGFDGSFAYSKLDPQDVGASTVVANLITADQITTKHGWKAATLTAFELGYTADVMDLGKISMNVEMATSKNFRNDDSEATVKGARLAHDLGPVKLYGVYHQTSFKGFKTVQHGTNALAKDVDSWIVGAYYKF
ncbi:MAG TPA: hypothetical protein QF353_05145 [Gammaproteobacteria bacterium]|nr:hypothetical protein [Gammaproteobacteria bacterium]